MKHFNYFACIILLVAFTGLVQCTHEDEDVIPVVGPDPIEHGDETLICTDCTPLEANVASSDFNSGNVPPGEWYFDKAHSNVMWESPYKVFGSDLTGRFNYFVVENLHFDESDPASLEFSGYVRLNTVNTGEPGRDAGCLLGTFGTEAGKTNETENIAMIVSKSNTGKYSSTDSGFIVEADFTFNGFTHPVTVKLYYFTQSDQSTYEMAGFSGQFEFNPLSDFGISSTNIDDHVVVKLNLLFKNKNS